MALTKADILSRRPKIKSIDLPNGGGTVFVRSWTALEFNHVRTVDAEDKNFGLQLAMSLCDENGNREFDPDKEEDAKTLGDAFTLGETQMIIAESLSLSLPGKKEDIKKNSEKTPSTDSVST